MASTTTAAASTAATATRAAGEAWAESAWEHGWLDGELVGSRRLVDVCVV